MNFDPIAKFLVIAGVVSIVAGLLWQSGLIQMLSLGKLPGDIVVENDRYRFYFPIVTSLVLSALLSFILWLFRR
jgi:hypothetical protein